MAQAKERLKEQQHQQAASGQGPGAHGGKNLCMALRYSSYTSPNFEPRPRPLPETLPVLGNSQRLAIHAHLLRLIRRLTYAALSGAELCRPGHPPYETNACSTARGSARGQYNFPSAARSIRSRDASEAHN
eukprot:3998199-Pleurochrysis_carterae.AAC.5